MASLNCERLVLTAPRCLAWQCEELPPLGPRDVLVRTQAAAISLGSELPVYLGTARASRPIAYPRGVGYESLGVVKVCGAAVARVRRGERVVAFFGHRTHAVVPESRVIVVPDGLSDALAILSILTCDAAKGVRKLAPRPEEPALITGAGEMGLLTLFLLRAYGVAWVDVVEPLPERHALARALGARRVWHPEELAAEGEAYAVAFECSSRNAAFTLLQRQMRREGRICVTADGNLEPLALTSAFHERELQLVGTSDGWDYHAHATWFFATAPRYADDLERLFELRITRDALISTVSRLAAGELRPVKVLVSY
jgi:alcohol dehydrogenase